LAAQLFGDTPAAEVVIAEVDGQPAGFALFFHNFSTFLGKRGLYLEDLYVKPEYRGLGLGRRLMVHLAGLAIARDCGRFEWSVLDWNAPAIAFYRELGAQPMDQWTVQRVSGDALHALAARTRRGIRNPCVCAALRGRVIVRAIGHVQRCLSHFDANRSRACFNWRATCFWMIYSWGLVIRLTIHPAM
jgi:predicted acetyltransferase